MNIAPRDYAPRRNADIDLLKERIRTLETQRILLVLAGGVMDIALIIAFVWMA